MEQMPLVKVGLIGFGTVGTGVVKYLQENGDRVGLRLCKVAVSDPSKQRGVECPVVTGDVGEVLDDPDIQIVAELVGGEEPALGFVSRAMESGKGVVTANKVVISRHMTQLFDMSRTHRVDLAFEASVAGSIPVIRVLKGYQGERITHVTGILNGTSNFILSRMEEGMDFEGALKIAQQKGFAEAEHNLDTGGLDARDKLAIVASLVYNTHVQPEDIYCEGITSVTPIDLDFATKHRTEEGESGFSVKSLASARYRNGSLELHVYPALISKDHPLASVRDEVNAIYIEGEWCGPQLFQGRGAGCEATSSAVISDIIRLSRNIRNGVVDDLPRLDSHVRFTDVATVKNRAYVRMNLKHMPGSLAEASRILGRHGFNIEDSIQRRRFRTVISGQTVIPDICTVEPIDSQTVEEALAELKASNRIHGEPFFLRFEE